MKPEWKKVREDQDIVYEKWDGIAKITINRPEVRNAFRPQTLFAMRSAFTDAHEDPDVGVIILTGAGDQAFCSGGDQRIRGDQGYVGKDGVPRLNVLDLQKQIRSLPKPVVAMVAGYAIGGGHVFPGAGHAPHLEVPEAYARELQGFLFAPWIERPLVDSELGSNP